MVVKRMAKRGTETKPKPANEAPITWDGLLRDAIEQPGTIAAAFKRFHNYSLGNAMLITWQCAARKIEIGPVAAYGRWQDLGRQVKKGEKALLICMPRPFTIKETDKKTGEVTQKRLTTFVYRAAVFAYAQTEAIPGKEDKSGQLDAFPADWSADAAMTDAGVTFAPYTDTDGNCQGYYQPKTRTIALNPMAEHPERTLLHELAHAHLHPNGYEAEGGQAICEFEAEATAMLVGYSLDLGGADESRGYCQHWLSRMGGQFVLTERTAGRIFAKAQRILKAGRGEIEQVEEQAVA